MMDYDKNHWKTPCPKVDCKKKACKCGLRFVSVPAELEQEMVPENGKYCNAIVRFEGSGSIYIYSAEGIPVLVKEGTNASQE